MAPLAAQCRTPPHNYPCAPGRPDVRPRVAARSSAPAGSSDASSATACRFRQPGACSCSCSRSSRGCAGASGGGWSTSRPRAACRAAASGSAAGTTDTVPAGAAHHQHHEQQPEQQPVLVALGTSSTGAAKAILRQLAAHGSAEVWATSAANHFTAIQALAEAHTRLAKQRQQQQQQQPQGLAATASIDASDQPVADDQKRSLRKLTLRVFPAPAVDAVEWQPGADSHASSNRTKAVGDLVAFARQRMDAGGGSANGGGGGGGAAVVEARGEQAVTRALKAAVSLQAAESRAVALQPWQGPVVDVVAEKRGQQRTADGLLLRMCWASGLEGLEQQAPTP